MKRLRQMAYYWLRRSESFFKTDMVYLAKGGFWLNGGQALTSIASFGLAILFARFVPKEEYGNYKYILSVAGLAATFTLTGLSTGVMQSVARGFRGTFIKASKLLGRWNITILAVSLGAASYYLYKDNTTLGYGLIAVALLYPATRTFEIYEAYLAGRKDFRRSAIYRGTVDIATIALTAAALLVTDSVIALVVANLTAQLALNFFFFKKIYNSIPEAERDHIEPGIIEFSKHVSLQNVLVNLAGYIDKIIIFQFVGATQVAIYTFASAVPQQVKGLLSNVTLMITPKISQRSAKEAVAMIPKRFFLSLVILGPAVVLYILLAPAIFGILFPAYMEAVPYTRWYALVLLIMGNLSSLVLTTQKAAREQYILTTFGSLSQITLMMALVIPFGILGIIWALLISKFSTAILSYILVRRFAKNQPSI